MELYALHLKYPAWIEENKATVPAEDLTRYEQQSICIKELVVYFDSIPETGNQSQSLESSLDDEKVKHLMEKVTRCLALQIKPLLDSGIWLATCCFTAANRT